MARKPKVVTTEEQDRKVMRGAPEDGAPYVEPDADRELEPDDDNDTPPEEEPEDPMETLKKGFNDLRREIADMRRNAPPDPRKAEPEPEPEDEFSEDFESQIIADPKKALKEYGAKLEKRIEKRLEARYRTERTQEVFWLDFYKKNPDLEADKDLVQATLNKHYNDLADMQADQALTKLAGLTRDRIARYAGRDGGAGGVRKKVSVEGARAPSGRRTPPPEPEKPVTLSAMLKARRARHHKGTAA